MMQYQLSNERSVLTDDVYDANVSKTITNRNFQKN
jgi:hypothetical protein